jgi:hypothetical protein
MWASFDEVSMNQTPTTLFDSLEFRSTTHPARAASKSPRAILLDFLDRQTALVNVDMDEREFRYGNRPMELLPGKSTIFAGSCLRQVADRLSTIRRAVENGEADGALAVAARKARRKSA